MSFLRTRAGSIAVWGALVFALSAWGAFVYLTFFLADKRAEYADAKTVAEQNSERSALSARLRALVQGTEVERASIESIASARLVDVAETIEKAVRDAGARGIEISEANASTPNAQGISGVSIGVSATGSFSSLMRAVLLLESLTLPSMLEQFELVKTEKEWRLVARLRLTLAAIQ